MSRLTILTNSDLCPNCGTNTDNQTGCCVDLYFHQKKILTNPTLGEKFSWNAAVEACCERVFSDGVELHPDLVQSLRELKK